jgi:drug/metabolite transporter (DMT)-like permease
VEHIGSKITSILTVIIAIVFVFFVNLTRSPEVTGARMFLLILVVAVLATFVAGVLWPWGMKETPPQE